MIQHTFHYGTERLDLAKAMALADGKLNGVLSEEATDKINNSQAMAQQMANEELPVYGINTGFGPLCTTKIAAENTVQLQYNLLRSHSVGVGKPVPKIIAKLMLITKMQALAQGYSGIRLATLERINWHIEEDVIPIVPEKGSVGASGDLAPLAHLFLPLIGQGEVDHRGQVLPAMEVLNTFGLKPLDLGPKEALALINGTQFILSYGLLLATHMSRALDLADLIGALSLEGLQGSVQPFLPELQALRPYQGSQWVAKRLTAMLEGSDIAKSHIGCDRVQDPYSLRCMPAVHGASRNAWLHLKEMLEVELNAVTDNPIILSDGRSISGGNFHGQPLAIPLDYATIAAAELGNISERRSYLLLEGKYGLPQMLIKNAGLNSGFMLPQYTAAALVTENRALCFPTSADSVPTGMGQEDHVSMGSISGRKAYRVMLHVEHILSIELMYAVQAIDFRRPCTSSPLLEEVHAFVRERVSHVAEDRVFSKDMQVLHQLITDDVLGAFVRKRAKAMGLDISTPV